MPQRRSQNLSLDDPLISSRAFGRRRKPTTRAEQSSKTTDRAAPFDQAVPLDRAALLDRRRREALIPSNVDEPRLSSTSSQFSSSESQLSSLSRRSESSSLRRSRSDSFASSLCSEY
jgi:hypothetical protein